MTHPYLIEPARARAFAYLAANPSGSRAKWAKALGWTPSKVQRFIEALVRFRLAEIEVIKGHNFSVFTPLIEPPISARSAPGQRPDRNRSATDQAHLEALDTGYLVSRCEKLPANGGNAEAMTCIAVVNEVLFSNFGSAYAPIKPDNRGSHQAVRHWLAVGIPLEAMTRLLRAKAAVFNPSKINGDMPRSLGFFTKWILKEWAIEQRQLPLPLMTVESGASAIQEYKPEPAGVTDPAVVSAVMLDVAAQLGVKR